MKFNYKSILAGITTLSLVVNMTAFGVAWKEIPTKSVAEDTKKYTYYQDFSNTVPGEAPVDFGPFDVPSGTAISTVNGYNQEGVKKKLLKMYDANPSDSVSFCVPLNIQPGKKALFKIRYKLESLGGELMSYRFRMIASNNKRAYYVTQYSTGGKVAVNNDLVSSGTITSQITQAGEWYTLEVLINQEDRKGAAQMLDYNGTLLSSSDIDFHPEAGNYPIDKIMVETTSRVGELYVDYIAITDGVDGFSSLKPPRAKLPLPKVPTPTYNVMQDTIGASVSLGAKKLYFTNFPYREGEVIYAPVRELLVHFGYNVTLADGVYTAVKDGKEIKIDTQSGTFDGKKLETGFKGQSTVKYISVSEFATLLGHTSSVSDAGIVIE